MIRVTRLYVLGLLLPVIAQAGYAPLGQPDNWTFEAPTPAFNPETGEQMGDFQPGIRVNVLQTLDTDTGPAWLVEYPRYGSPPIRARIGLPDLSVNKPRAYQRVQSDIAQFPLLEEQLEADRPWGVTLPELAKRLQGGEVVLIDGTVEDPRTLISSNPHRDGFAWKLMPIEVRLTRTPSDNLRVTINYWNKGDRDSVVDPRRGYETLKEKLQDIQDAFGTRQGFGAGSNSGNGISALRDDAEAFFLPNDIVAQLRYRPDEYLILELHSFRNANDTTPSNTGRTYASHVATSDDGERYISDIPMISQGNKGYCVAATLARVLSYYGYPVDMYSVAELAETERYGTSLDSMVTAMRRVSGTAPLRMKEIDKDDPATIRSIIEQGLPIVWLIPRHCRLIIGIHPDNDTIVYSDSWGAEHAYKTMSYEDFLSLNQHMYILAPR